MLMVLIVHWGHDWVIRPIDSVRELHALKQRLDIDDMDFIPYESWLPTPFILDQPIAVRELSDSEVEEHLRGTVYPQLIEEGRMVMDKRKGRPVLVRNPA